jgi:hypothetical protein
MEKYTLEKFTQIYDNETGCCIKIGPDAEGYGLVEIKQCNPQGQEEAMVTLTQEEARLLCRALDELYGE